MDSMLPNYVAAKRAQIVASLLLAAGSDFWVAWFAMSKAERKQFLEALAKQEPR